MLKQLMSDLPHDRQHPERSFANVGVDFLGPFRIHYQIHGKNTKKAYLVIFVHFWSKAVLLEVGSDLTKESFLAALKRFIGKARWSARGGVDHVLSFAGTYLSWRRGRMGGGGFLYVFFMSYSSVCSCSRHGCG